MHQLKVLCLKVFINLLQSYFSNYIKFQTEERPSTSRHCQKRISPTKNNNEKRSPWRNAGGKANRFKKILDDQARRLIKRSVHFIKDNRTPRKCTPRKKVTKRSNNSSKTNAKMIGKRKSKCALIVNSLEEGEILTDDEEILLSNELKATSNSNDNEEDEDDCFVIEPNIDKITIDDDDNEDDELPSCSDVSTIYQSLVHSFKERLSSTPHRNNCSNTLVETNSKDVDGSRFKPLSFFVDICGRRSGLESINSRDTFADYSTLSTIGDKSTIKYRKVHLKENNCSEVINLDDSEYSKPSSTLKRKSCEKEDDSVIFVSETNKNDFIPIIDDNIPPHKKLKISETNNTPVDRRVTNSNSLFTRSETKKLNEYNENAYNPSGDKTLTSSKRMVIIDGSNVAFKHGLDQSFSVKGLKIAIDYFEKMGHEVKAVIPQFRMNKSKSTDPEELERLHKAGKMVQTPCKNLPGLTSTSYDDRFILQLAFELDAAIVSNDNYRDLLHENPAFKKIIENRVIGYTWCNDIFILPKDPYGKWGPTLDKILNR